jgi:hypothetical protein
MTQDLAGSDAMRLACAQVHALAADLTGRGFTVMVRDNGMLALEVASQAAPTSCQHIIVETDDNGAWWFWWSWGDQLARITDIEATAFKIAYVLTPQAGADPRGD